VAEVRDRYLAVHQFLKACGYRAVEVLRDYCLGPDDRSEDAYLFEFVPE
jgi:non-homologous end joining protein Ku